MIRRTKKGWKVVSEEGKNLGGPYSTEAQAEDRLAEVHMFEHMDKKKKSSRK